MSIYRCHECGRINRVTEKADASHAPHCGHCKADLDTSGLPQNVNAKELRKAIKHSPIPVLLDIWAPWCGPCRMVAPVLEEIGKERRGELMILKLNSDENQEMSGRLKVSGIPTMIVFKSGKESARQAGAMNKSGLNSWLTPLV